MRVFVSSTFEDLTEYREAAFTAIHSLGGYSDDMVYWSADERDSATYSVDRVKQSDVLILLLAHRYGYVPEGSDYSITEMEYRTASDSNTPVLAFLVDESIPWPPSDIDWEQRDKLEKFKEKISAEVTWKTFGSPDELSALVTQALAVFIQRYQDKLEKRKGFTGTTIQTEPVVKISAEPDIVIQVGWAEDGLPLLLQIKRSRDLSYHLNQLSDLVSSPYEESPMALIDNFRQALEQHALSTWANYQIHEVAMNDGSVQEMYFSARSLSELTSSLMARILGTGERLADATSYGTGTVGISTSAAFDDSDEDRLSKLQSIGGRNRFLGISLSDGKAYSVGWQSDVLVEWRPFFFESIPLDLDDSFFLIEAQGEEFRVSAESYHSILHEKAIQNESSDGSIDVRVQLSLSRQSVGELILRISEELAALHVQGRIHGDLKPNNILLTTEAPTLIDNFNLREGDRAPGWTPGWSAPEQVMSEPITFTSDIYPLGVMVSRLLGGSLVGEVRRFRIPPTPSGMTEYDLLSNPSVYVSEPTTVAEGEIREWLAFTKRCLRFDPTERPGSVEEFVEQFEKLLSRFPLQGDVEVPLLESQLVAATLLDGSESVARLLDDRYRDSILDDDAADTTEDLFDS